MKSPAPVPLGPWIKGIQNVNDPAMTPKGCVVEADNVLIDSDGTVRPRLGYAPVVTNVHSIFKYGEKTYGVFNGQICELHESVAKPLGFMVEGKVTWSVLNDAPMFTNLSVLARINGDVVEPIPVEPPSKASARPDGGDILYSGAEGEEEIGVPYEYLNKAPMPGGNYARYWRGRLLVARGRTLYISDPLRYGMYDQSAGFVSFEARIDFIEPVEGGVYVALRNVGVHFLAGEAPEKWELRVASVIPAQAGASLIIPTAQMKLEWQSKPEWVAVWLTNKGFALGLPTGNVVFPQADLLSGLPLGTGSLHFEGDRLIALSQ